MLKKIIFSFIPVLIFFLFQLNLENKNYNKDSNVIKPSLDKKSESETVNINTKNNLTNSPDFDEKLGLTFIQKTEKQQLETLFRIEAKNDSSKSAYILNLGLVSKYLKVSSYAQRVLNNNLESSSGAKLEHYVSNNIYELSATSVKSLCRNKNISTEQKLRLSYLLNKVDIKINFRACNS